MYAIWAVVLTAGLRRQRRTASSTDRPGRCDCSDCAVLVHARRISIRAPTRTSTWSDKDEGPWRTCNSVEVVFRLLRHDHGCGWPDPADSLNSSHNRDKTGRRGYPPIGLLTLTVFILAFPMKPLLADPQLTR